jgi:uncharacterized damage-inducible protein DinB
MIDHIKKSLTSQFEASLCMVNQCVAACQPEYWEGKIANDTFRQVAYHTLFFTDLYLSSNEQEFQLRELHSRGGDERGLTLSAGLSREETLSYVTICRQKMVESLAAETSDSLQGWSGFSWRKISRCELHIYNIRHIQHHAGQLSAYLRRVDATLGNPKTLPWVGDGWR